MNSFRRTSSSIVLKHFITSRCKTAPIGGAYKASHGNKNIVGIHLDFFSCQNQQRPYHNESHIPKQIELLKYNNTVLPCAASIGFSPICLESPWMRLNRRYSSTMHHSSSASKSNEVGEQPKKGESKARMFFNKYGYVFVGTYLSIYVLTLLSFFFGLDSGLLDPSTLAQVLKVSKNLACETADVLGPTGTGASMDEAATAYADGVSAEVREDGRTLVEIVKSYMRKFEWTSGYAQTLEENPHLANLGVAWFIVKFTEPIRLAAAVMVTPKVAKIVGRKAPKL